MINGYKVTFSLNIDFLYNISIKRGPSVERLELERLVKTFLDVEYR